MFRYIPTTPRAIVGVLVSLLVIAVIVLEILDHALNPATPQPELQNPSQQTDTPELPIDPKPVVAVVTCVEPVVSKPEHHHHHHHVQIPFGTNYPHHQVAPLAYQLWQNAVAAGEPSSDRDKFWYAAIVNLEAAGTPPDWIMPTAHTVADRLARLPENIRAVELRELKVSDPVLAAAVKNILNA